ncbi:MAG: hypothetical protein QNJ51_20150 [Calothrix sp. MO_167.B12]|nr:hypothetical protein [Calothrix sp. MO_167.B12]
MNNSKIFSDLALDETIKLESALQNLFLNIDGVAGRRGILRNAGIDNYFIANLDFNLGISEFTTILISKFKDYSVSRSNPSHPLIQLADYILKQPQQKYNLDDENIEIFRIIILIGQKKLEALTASSPQTNQQSSPSESQKSSPVSKIDVLVITALKDELDALKICDNNSGKSWEEYQDNLGYSYYKKTFGHSNGSNLTIAAASAVDMGENRTTELASRLITQLKPSYLAMTGICAGNKEDVFLGDVIVADRVFKFDYGKLIAYYEEIAGQKIRTEEIFHDITTYNIKPLWKHKIDNFSPDWMNTIQTSRPKSYLHQERWLLHKLYDYQQEPNSYQNPVNHSERQSECPEWKKIITRLSEQELLTIDPFKFTNNGLKAVEQERLLNPDNQRYQDKLSPEVHIGVIATTSKVQKDPEIFERLKKLQRKALGVEMESAAIGAVAEIHEIPMIVVKSVQDYADYDKNDKFRFYAAETSARFLLAFFATSSAIIR